MPKPRYGKIPIVRLRDARKVRDHLRKIVGDNGYVVVSIYKDGFCVCVYIDDDSQIPRDLDGVHIKLKRRAKII